jgi:uncharacterized protein YggE
VEEPRVITVTGEAEVRVVPDEVILTLGVETWNKVLDTAKRENDEIVREVLAAADAQGIEPAHVQTDYVSIEPRYRNGYYEDRDFVGYFVHKTIEVRLRDLDRFETFLSDALESGVNYVHGIRFRTTELRDYRDEARALAVRAAREKARDMAEVLDEDIGRPRQIAEAQSSWWSGYGSWWGARWGDAMSQNVIQEFNGSTLSVDSSVAPGQIEIVARVTVTFDLAD